MLPGLPISTTESLHKLIMSKQLRWAMVDATQLSPGRSSVQPANQRQWSARDGPKLWILAPSRRHPSDGRQTCSRNKAPFPQRCLLDASRPRKGPLRLKLFPPFLPLRWASYAPRLAHSTGPRGPPATPGQAEVGMGSAKSALLSRSCLGLGMGWLWLGLLSECPRESLSTWKRGGGCTKHCAMPTRQGDEIGHNNPPSCPAQPGASHPIPSWDSQPSSGCSVPLTPVPTRTPNFDAAEIQLRPCPRSHSPSPSPSSVSCPCSCHCDGPPASQPQPLGDETPSRRLTFAALCHSFSALHCPAPSFRLRGQRVETVDLEPPRSSSPVLAAVITARPLACSNLSPSPTDNHRPFSTFFLLSIG
jgi:hypothetical protein